MWSARVVCRCRCSRKATDTQLKVALHFVCRYGLVAPGAASRLAFRTLGRRRIGDGLRMLVVLLTLDGHPTAATEGDARTTKRRKRATHRSASTSAPPPARRTTSAATTRHTTTAPITTTGSSSSARRTTSRARYGNTYEGSAGRCVDEVPGATAEGLVGFEPLLPVAAGGIVALLPVQLATSVALPHVAAFDIRVVEAHQRVHAHTKIVLASIGVVVDFFHLGEKRLCVYVGFVAVLDVEVRVDHEMQQHFLDVLHATGQ
mmetsp:Transcript_38563/g.110289  ORF Transcript_38563/g.110289 Transcript_38563/m.110289 type:complete len:261 (-) Transcript_38563:454-1236(-)